MGWVVVGEIDASLQEANNYELVWERAKSLLRESDWAMLPDIPMTVAQKESWVEYRRALREIRSQSGFPNDVKWPIKPE